MIHRLGMLALLGFGGPAIADDPPVNLAEIRAELNNATLSPDERATRTLDAAATLDRAAQRARTATDRRARWRDAIGLIDGCLEKPPPVDSFPMLRFQAGVYAWAEGRSFADQADLAPGDAPARLGAIKALDDAIARFRSIAINPDQGAEPFAQNVRFRLAQAIADRTRFDPEGTPSRTAAEVEAVGLLDPSIAAPGLRGFALLLRAELNTRLGHYGQAQVEIEAAEKADPPPPAGPVLEARVASLTGREMFDEALKIVAESKVDEALKGLLGLRLILARRGMIAPGRRRDAIDAEALRAAEKLRGSGRPEARRASIELARALDDPGPNAPPESWDVLADGFLKLGNPAKAGRLLAKGADRADAAGQADRAAQFRYKSGACLFEAEKFAEVDAVLARLIETPAAPRDLRARAGMLRTLARGRAVAARQAGASKDAYLSALESQVRDFPDDPATGEARWLLGKVRVAGDRKEDAIALWSRIPHGHARWLESRLAIIDLRTEAVEDQRINRDQSATRTKMELARRSTREARDSAAEGGEAVALDLRIARLELVPESGQAADALEACDRLLKVAAHPDQHRQARLLRVVALAALHRYPEAEQVARSEAKLDQPAALLPAIRLLDRLASEADAETIRRRLGLILKGMTPRLVDHPDQIPASARDEARVRHARALLFAGDPAAARQVLSEWGGPAEIGDNPFLRDLADTYLRLDAFPLAIDAEKIRGNRLAPGSLPWFEARYGLALACYRSGRVKDARQVIDATAILHPDLGGGELRGKFEKLSQRITQE